MSGLPTVPDIRPAKDNFPAFLSNKPLRYVGISLACLGVIAAIAKLTSSLHPTQSPFRDDVFSLTNDVGERIIVTKETVRLNLIGSKKLFVQFVDQAGESVKTANMQVNEYSFSSCKEAAVYTSQGDSYATQQADSQSNENGEGLAKYYAAQANAAFTLAERSRSQCAKDIANAKAEHAYRAKTVVAIRRLITRRGIAEASQRIVSLYDFKLLVTDVNGNTNVVPAKSACLTKTSINYLPLNTRKKIAPHMFVNFEKPRAVAIARIIIERNDGVFPTEDAVNMASQSVCTFAGLPKVESDLKKL
jgi:hypothetical protein